jgi:hypothetical protein
MYDMHSRLCMSPCCADEAGADICSICLEYIEADDKPSVADKWADRLRHMPTRSMAGAASIIPSYLLKKARDHDNSCVGRYTEHFGADSIKAAKV